MNYDTIKICKTVSALEAGRALGLEINHSSRCKCPVHGGRDYNMKLYTGDRGYFCFVCHAKGDVIALVQNVLNCAFQDAIKWLSDEFHLGIGIDTPVDRKALQRAKKRARMRRELEEKCRQTDRRVYDGYLDACDMVRQIDRIIEDKAPKPEDEEWDEAFCTALRHREEAKEILSEYEDMVTGRR